MPNIYKLPQWAQEIIKSSTQERDSLDRRCNRQTEKIAKLTGDIQALLDIVRNLRPSLYDRWNEGVSLDQLVKESKGEL